MTTDTELTAADRLPFRALTIGRFEHRRCMSRAIVPAVVKENHLGAPGCLPNGEFAGSRLAQLLGLPTPPSFMVRAEGGGSAFCAVAFEDPSMVTVNDQAEAFLECGDPGLAWGVILFDVWVGNPDRAANFAFDTPRRRLHLFDFECSMHEPLQCGGDPTMPGAEELLISHFLARRVRTIEGYHEWLGRIQTLPRWQIEDVCREAGEHGMPRWETAIDWLDKRRRLLPELILKAHGVFKELDLVAAIK